MEKVTRVWGGEPRSYVQKRSFCEKAAFPPARRQANLGQVRWPSRCETGSPPGGGRIIPRCVPQKLILDLLPETMVK